jgi:hypothetical protein
MTNAYSERLAFEPFVTYVDAAFWQSLAEHKLHKWMLDTAPVPIVATFDNSACTHARVHCSHRAAYRPSLPCRVSPVAFDRVDDVPLCMHGRMHLTNTIDEFRALDFKQLLRADGELVWANIVNGVAVHQPQTLNSMLLAVYAVSVFNGRMRIENKQDLKKYVYTYWFAYTAICAPSGMHLLREPTVFAPSDHIRAALFDYLRSTSRQWTFFIDAQHACVRPLSALVDAEHPFDITDVRCTWAANRITSLHTDCGARVC